MNKATGINGDIAGTIDGHYYLGCGARGGKEREVVFDARGNGNGDISPTITGDHQDRVTDYTALCVGNSWDGSEISPTLTANNAGGCQRMPDKDNFNAVISYGLDRASYNQGKNAQFDFSVEEERIGAQTAKGPGAVYKMVVRRLTPLEVERLQGYPSGWTDIGEWTDSKGKKHKDADSPRYKALGNSIALPFWFWLMRRISAQYERPATLGSLFDGIGGFPLCHEKCNGKGTALWASEIEEFCIAVTKERFGDE